METEEKRDQVDQRKKVILNNHVESDESDDWLVCLKPILNKTFDAYVFHVSTTATATTITFIIFIPQSIKEMCQQYRKKILAYLFTRLFSKTHACIHR